MADFLKDYEPVEDRLRAFWSDHPNGRVMTTLVHHDAGSYIVRAEVFIGDGLDWPTASGLAHDSEDQLPPNMKTSALEVCETSAIGRALANLGYAAKGKRPSREEMQKASPAQDRMAVTPSGVASGDTTSEGSRSAGEDRGAAVPSDTTSGPEAGGRPSRVPTPAQDPGPGTTSDVGEASGSAPGEDSAIGTSPGVTKYYADPTTCTHKLPSGRWIRWNAEGRCPRCGTTKLLAMEG